MKFYPYHSGNLPPKIYEKATTQILNKIFKFCDMKKIIKPLVKNYQETSKNDSNIDYQNLVQIYSKELLSFAKKNNKAIILDADLTKDSGSSEVMTNLPKQFL